MEGRTPEFLTLADVLKMHATSLARWGGQDGVRDLGAVESAVMQPQAMFGGEYLHEDVFAMAAAYAFHISESQAFFDGSKRTAVFAALGFLELNGVLFPEPQDDILYLAMIDVANHAMSKAQLAQLFRDLATTSARTPRGAP